MPVAAKKKSKRNGRGRSKKNPSPTAEEYASTVPPLDVLLSEQATEESEQGRESVDSTLQLSPKDGDKSVSSSNEMSSTENSQSDVAEPPQPDESDNVKVDVDKANPKDEAQGAQDQESKSGTEDGSIDSYQSADSRKQIPVSQHTATASDARGEETIQDQAKTPKENNQDREVALDHNENKVIKGMMDDLYSTEHAESSQSAAEEGGTGEEARKSPDAGAAEGLRCEDKEEAMGQDTTEDTEKEEAKPAKGRGKRALKKAADFAHRPGTDTQSQPTSDTTESVPVAPAKKRRSPYKKPAKGSKKKRGAAVVDQDTKTAQMQSQKEVDNLKEVGTVHEKNTGIPAEAKPQMKAETEKDIDTDNRVDTQTGSKLEKRAETHMECDTQVENVDHEEGKIEGKDTRLEKDVTLETTSAQQEGKDAEIAQQIFIQKETSGEIEEKLSEEPSLPSDTEVMPEANQNFCEQKVIETTQGPVTEKRGGRKAKSKETDAKYQDIKGTRGKRVGRKATTVEVPQEVVTEASTVTDGSKSSKRGGRKAKPETSKKSKAKINRKNTTMQGAKQANPTTLQDEQIKEKIPRELAKTEVDQQSAIDSQAELDTHQEYSQASTLTTADEGNDEPHPLEKKPKGKAGTIKGGRKAKGKAKNKKESDELSMSKPDKQTAAEEQLGLNEDSTQQESSDVKTSEDKCVAINIRNEDEEKEVSEQSHRLESHEIGEPIVPNESKTSAPSTSYSSHNTEESDDHSAKPTRKSARAKKERVLKRRSPRTASKFLEDAKAENDANLQKFITGDTADSEDTPTLQPEESGTAETKDEEKEERKAAKRPNVKALTESPKQPKIATNNQPEILVSLKMDTRDTEEFSGHVVPTLDNRKKQAMKRKAATKGAARKGKTSKKVDEVDISVQASAEESITVVKENQAVHSPKPSNSALNSTYTADSTTSKEENKEKKTPEVSDSESSASGQSSASAERPPIANKYVGAHVSVAHGLHKGVMEAASMGARAFAMFIKNQRSWKHKNLEDRAVQRFKLAMQEYGYSPHMVVPHGGYLMNLSSPDAEIREKSADMLVHELQMCDKLGLPIFNFHPGSTCGKMSTEEGIRKIAAGINNGIAKTHNVIVVLENMACQGYTIGGRFEELRDIISLIHDKSRVGVCFDTCHAMAAGYDLSTESGYVASMQAFDSIIGFRYLKAVHINDSKGPAGNRADKHEDIGKGTIGMEGFRRIMNDPRFDNIPFILETPGGDYDKQIKKLYKLCRK